MKWTHEWWLHGVLAPSVYGWLVTLEWLCALDDHLCTSRGIPKKIP